jgi:hypothetical protein
LKTLLGSRSFVFSVISWVATVGDDRDLSSGVGQHEQGQIDIMPIRVDWKPNISLRWKSKTKERERERDGEGQSERGTKNGRVRAIKRGAIRKRVQERKNQKSKIKNQKSKIKKNRG